jgi:beta-glucanase (GH16 family)
MMHSMTEKCWGDILHPQCKFPRIRSGFFMKRNLASSLCALVFLASPAFADPPAGYSLVWSDEFEGPALDTTIWTNDTGPSYGADYQAYTSHNVTIENSAAVLWVKHEKHGYYDYTSSWIHTRAKKKFQYGYIEVKLKALYGSGPWAAFWTQGANTVVWPECGEIELYSQKTGPRNFSTDSGDSSFVVSCVFKGASVPIVYNEERYDYSDCLCDGYHLYAIEWDSLGIKYYFDGNKFREYNAINETYNFSSFHQPHYFNVNVTVHAPRDTTIFPQKMYIDYVRVYQKSTQANLTHPKSLHTMPFADPSRVQLKVYNLQGRQIADYMDLRRFMKSGGKVMKNLPSNLPAGIYIVRLVDGGKMVSERLVVHR